MVFGFPGVSPVVSANNGVNGILWAVRSDQYFASGSSVLYAFQANKVSVKLYDSTQARAAATMSEGAEVLAADRRQRQGAAGASGEQHPLRAPPNGARRRDRQGERNRERDESEPEPDSIGAARWPGGRRSMTVSSPLLAGSRLPQRAILNSRFAC